MVKQFTGVDDPCEEPENPEVVIETGRIITEESVKEILDFLVHCGKIGFSLF